MVNPDRRHHHDHHPHASTVENGDLSPSTTNLTACFVTLNTFTPRACSPPVGTRTMAAADPLTALPTGTFPLHFAPTAAAALTGSKRAVSGEVVAFKCESDQRP